MTSTWSPRLVNLSGSMASCFHAKFGKYCSTDRLFTVNLPDPARRKTHAMDSLRRPVPRNQFVPDVGEALELNIPPSDTDTGPKLPGRRTSRLGFPYSTKECTATCGKL